MKFEPRSSQAVGRMVIKQSSSSIILSNETKVTKFILVDAVGTEAEANGIKVGDLVLPKVVYNVVLEAGSVFCPWFEEKDVVLFVRDVKREDLLVQTAAGTKFVPFDSPDAAKPLVAQAMEAA